MKEKQRLLFIPQYPTKMRYQEWWYKEFPKKMSKYFNVCIIDKPIFKPHLSERQMFSPINEAIKYELNQCEEFINFNVRDDDILFLADISFPGNFCNVLYHKRIKNAYAFCHATSINYFDYFSPVRGSKWRVEKAHSRLFKKVFVGSYYHREKLYANGWRTDLSVLPLPLPPFKFKSSNEKSIFVNTQIKKFDIVSVSRPTSQKVDLEFEKKLEKDLNINIVRSVDFIKTMSWKKYYEFLKQSKIMIITAQEETFGYQVIDALLNNCIPIAPNAYSYPGLLPSHYLYDDYDECVERVTTYLKYPMMPDWEDLKEQCENFYDNLAKEIGGK